MNDRSSLVKGIQEYCGSFDHKLERVCKGMMIFGAASSGIILLVMMIRRTLAVYSIVWIMAPLFFTLLAFAVSFDSSAKKTKRKLDKYRKRGILDEVAEDFGRSEPCYGDALRLGKSCIFGRDYGEFAPLSMIGAICRVRHDHYYDGRLDHTYYFIEIKYKVEKRKLCDLKAEQCFDDNAWKVFSEQLRWINDKIKIDAAVERRTTYSSSDSGD